MAFKKAERHAAKLRMAIHGPAGSGKTKTALLIASGLGSRIAVVDTENGSASRYAGEEGVPDFDVDEVRPPYLATLVAAKIREAHQAGYDVVIVDSWTAFWKGEGGVMSAVDDAADKAAARGGKRDGFGAWREGDRLYREMVEAIQAAPIHVIVTMRSKMSYEKSEDGKKINKVGYAPEMRDGAEYEFDLECSMDEVHTLAIGKTRITDLDGKMFRKPGRALGEGLARWLDGKPKPAAVTAPAPTPAPAAARTVAPTGPTPSLPHPEEPSSASWENMPPADAPPAPTPTPRPESERRPAPANEAPAADELLVEIANAGDPQALAAIAVRIKDTLDRKPDNARRAKLELAYSARKKALKTAAAPPPEQQGDDADNWDRGAA